MDALQVTVAESISGNGGDSRRYGERWIVVQDTRRADDQSRTVVTVKRIIDGFEIAITRSYSE